MTFPLHAALAQTAAALGVDDVSALVERVELRSRGALVVALRQDGRSRWFHFDAGVLEEVEPHRDRRLALLRTMLVEGGRGTYRVLSYRPGRRVVLEWSDGEQTLVLKGFRPEKAEAALFSHRQAELTNGDGGFLVPRVLEYRPSTDAIAFRSLTGAPLSIGRAGAESFARIGTHLAAFQSADLEESVPAFGPPDEMAVLDRWATRVGDAAGDLPVGWRDLRASLGLLVDDMIPPALVPCHRDLHDRQMLLTEEGIALLDFDMLCRADSALDPANLLAHVSLRTLQGLNPDGDEGVAACRAALLGDRERDDADFRRRRLFYEAATFLRLALVYAVRPRWWHLSPALLDQGRRRLGELHAPAAAKGGR